MQRQPIGHELASLPIGLALPEACRKNDPVKLRKIAEAQAIEIVKLRRALLAANSISAERLQIIWGMRGEDAEQEISLKDILKHINDLETDIYSIIKKSRWRKIGIMLGFEKHREWELNPWRSNLSLYSENLTSASSPAEYKPPLTSALNEQNRLIQLWLQVSQSRWRQLGLKSKLALELSLDIAHNGSFKHHAQFHLLKPQSEKIELKPVASRKTDYEDNSDCTRSRFLEECKAYAVEAILDVGAGIGQFGRGIRESGYQGLIYSFEPISAAHSELVFNARDDMLWQVVSRCVVGSTNSTGKIDIDKDAASSSILPRLSLPEDTTPRSSYLDCEDCPIITLDSFIENTFADRCITFGLKIDTQQGYVHKVIEGLRSCHQRVKVIACEMSLRPLNAESISMTVMCQQLSRLGFRCVALWPNYKHLIDGEIPQVDGVFISYS